jgi:broad specificity phosphatase PhoE
MLVIFEPHATTVDNENQVASGWNDVALSKKGEQQAKELGQRYNLSQLDAVFCADLQRSYRTAQLAFPAINTKQLFIDWRLRECDYGDMTLSTREVLDTDKIKRITERFPNGESYDQAMERMKSFIDDLQAKPLRKVLVIGSRATHYGFDHWLENKSLEELLNTKFAWQPGWKYKLTK